MAGALPQEGMELTRLRVVANVEWSRTWYRDVLVLRWCASTARLSY